MCNVTVRLFGSEETSEMELGNDMTVIELKDALRQRGLSTSEAKVELIKWLNEYKPNVWEELEAARGSTRSKVPIPVIRFLDARVIRRGMTGRRRRATRLVHRGTGTSRRAWRNALAP